MWEKSPSTSTFTWDNALASRHCNNLSVGNRKGWKLPSIQELLSLIDPTMVNPALPAGHPFIGVQSSVYWSATPFATDSTFAWDVPFSNGGVGVAAKSFAFFVWCVRGGPGADAQ